MEGRGNGDRRRAWRGLAGGRVAAAVPSVVMSGNCYCYSMEACSHAINAAVLHGGAELSVCACACERVVTSEARISRFRYLRAAVYGAARAGWRAERTQRRSRWKWRCFFALHLIFGLWRSVEGGFISRGSI